MDGDARLSDLPIMYIDQVTLLEMGSTALSRYSLILGATLLNASRAGPIASQMWSHFALPMYRPIESSGLSQPVAAAGRTLSWALRKMAVRPSRRDGERVERRDAKVCVSIRLSW